MLHHWRRRLRALWQPEMYHGWGRRRNYFEGWYYKLVDPTERHAIAVIPGIAYEPDGRAEAFIQVLDGKHHRPAYHAFPAEQFRPSGERFALQLGDNFFSPDLIELALPDLHGRLKLQGRAPWPNKWRAPGVMGWYAFVPMMECYHGVVSMDYQLEGALTHNGQDIVFARGKGYVEKDWGKSFPSSWIWMQCNHFDSRQRAGLMVSVARIPWLGSHFVGFLVGLLVGDRLHRFTTYTGASMQAELREQGVKLTFRDRRRCLEVEAEQGKGGTLVSPVDTGMKGRVNESMQAALKVQLWENGERLFAGLGRNAAMEMAGAVERELVG